MRTETPLIVTILRAQNYARYEADPKPLYLDRVDAVLSDGSVVKLFMAVVGEMSLTDDELIGLTPSQAITLAESRGSVF